MYDVEIDDDILIYGCGSLGQAICKNLNKSGYNVKAYIDKKADSIKECLGHPVLSIEQLHNSSSKHGLIIIALNSGIEHDDIAQVLNRLGFEKILYISMAKYSEYYVRSVLRRAYNCLCIGEDIPCSLCNLPYYSEIVNNEYDCSIIRKYDDYISFWCPVDDIYIIRDGINVSLKEFQPYRDLFCYLEGAHVELSDYIKETGRFDDDTWLISRQELYNLYCDALKFDTAFFSESPSTCEFDMTSKRVSIKEGVTRAHFLISKGYDRIPIVLSIVDFERWIQE